MLDFDGIDGWQDELEKIKEHASFRSPESFIQLHAYMRSYFHLSYRLTEGVIKAHARKVRSIPDYSIPCRRVNNLDVRVDEKAGNDIVIAFDSTGIKVSNR